MRLVFLHGLFSTCNCTKFSFYEGIRKKTLLCLNIIISFIISRVGPSCKGKLAASYLYVRS